METPSYEPNEELSVASELLETEPKIESPSTPTENSVKKIGYKDIFTQKEFMKLTIAGLISRFGDSIDMIAFTWLIYQVTQSASWSAIIFACNMLPTVLVQPFAGVLVERMRKKPVMVIADLVRGLLVAGLAILYLTDTLYPMILIIFTLIISTVEAFCNPASMAVTPKVLKSEYYEFGTSLSATLTQVLELIGLGAAGVIIGTFGVKSAFFIDAITFLISAAILFTLRFKDTELSTEKFSRKEYFGNLKEGFQYIKKTPVIRNFCLMGIFINAIMVPVNSLQTPLITEVLHQGSELLSVLNVAIIIGLALGSFFFPFFSRKLSVTCVVILSGFIVSASVFGLTLGRFFTEHTIAVYAIACFSSFLLGIGVSPILAELRVQFMKMVSEDYLSRVSALFNACVSAASPITSFMVSALVLKLSTAQILTYSGLLCAILFIFLSIKKVKFES